MYFRASAIVSAPVGVLAVVVVDDAVGVALEDVVTAAALALGL
jgi:hypothetical protein